jgi:hypothetical protein
MKTVSLKLDNCLDCPHHKVITSQYTGDSFDAGDVDVVCTLADGTRPARTHQRQGHQRQRPVRERSECAVPPWCPLTKKARPSRKHPCDKS